MYSVGHMICFYMVLLATIVEGSPRYRRQNFGQYVPLEKLNLEGQAHVGSNDLDNYNITGQAEANIPIYNGGANRPSVDLDATAGVRFGSSNGQLFGPNPSHDVGVNVHIPFGGRLPV